MVPLIKGLSHKDLGWSRAVQSSLTVLPDLFRHPTRNNRYIPLWRVGSRHKAGVTKDDIVRVPYAMPFLTKGMTS